MKKELEEMDDIELLLKPQCEFHASDTLKEEVVAKAGAEARPRRVRMLPWIAAACVAGVVVLFLMPPRQTEEKAAVVAEAVRRMPVAQTGGHTVMQMESEPVKVLAISKPQRKQPVMHTEAEEHPAAVIMLSEEDIPVSRPENLIDTPEDIAQMERLEDEAFISSMRELVEIAKADVINVSKYEEKN